MRHLLRAKAPKALFRACQLDRIGVPDSVLFAAQGTSRSRAFLEILVLRDDVYHERSGEKTRAEEVIRLVGTNAIPFLLNWARYEQPQWRDKAVQLARRLPTWALANWIEHSQSAKLANNSTEALRALGEIATPFISDLMQMLENGASNTAAGTASPVLASIGPNALPALISAIDSPSYSKHRGLIFAAVSNMHPPPREAEAVVPALIRCLDQTNIPHMAASTLGDLKAAPELSIPALVAHLENPDRDVRSSCAEALGLFGTNAVSAVPTLIALLRDRSSEVEDAAATALGKIALEPNLVIPALADATHTRADISSVRALGMFGQQATNALPLLTNLLSHPTWQARIQATNAIRSITAPVRTNTPTD